MEIPNIENLNIKLSKMRIKNGSFLPLSHSGVLEKTEVTIRTSEPYSTGCLPGSSQVMVLKQSGSGDAELILSSGTSCGSGPWKSFLLLQVWLMEVQLNFHLSWENFQTLLVRINIFFLCWTPLTFAFFFPCSHYPGVYHFVMWCDKCAPVCLMVW